MKLSDYTQRVAREQPDAHEDAAHDLEKLYHRLRTALYEEVPSERLARLADGDSPHARAELRAVVEQVMNERGIRVAQAQERRALIDDMVDMVLGLGPVENLLADDSVTEIMVNGARSVYYERDGSLHRSTESFASEEQLRGVVDRIVSRMGRRIDEQQPIVNARLPQGHRVNAVIPPLALDGTALTIRKFRNVSFTLGELTDNGTLSADMAQLLRWAVAARCNIAVSGGTGGGKTTLLNALSREIREDERIITIEDSAELKFDQHPHVIRLEARMANAEGRGEVGIRELVVNALRMRPDRIIVGECRSAEAADMLQAMTCGHDGSMTTLHANSPAEVVERLVMMVRYGMDLPVQVIESQIASALDVIVQQDRMGDGTRRITQIAVRNAHGDEPLFVPAVVWDRRAREYCWKILPDWIGDLPYLGIASKGEVDEWERGLQRC